MKPKTPIEIERIRRSGQILSRVLDRLERELRVGMTTGELDQLARQELKALGGSAPFLDYVPSPGTPPFPAVICISVNDEVVHGIPGGRILEEGDIVGLDFGVNYQGMITDSARTLPVGTVSPATARLLAATKQALAISHMLSKRDYEQTSSALFENYPGMASAIHCMRTH
jgi:methionyl aminopeptidase